MFSKKTISNKDKVSGSSYYDSLLTYYGEKGALNQCDIQTFNKWILSGWVLAKLQDVKWQDNTLSLFLYTANDIVADIQKNTSTPYAASLRYIATATERLVKQWEAKFSKNKNSSSIQLPDKLEPINKGIFSLSLSEHIVKLYAERKSYVKDIKSSDSVEQKVPENKEKEIEMSCIINPSSPSP